MSPSVYFKGIRRIYQKFIFLAHSQKSILVSKSTIVIETSRFISLQKSPYLKSVTIENMNTGIKKMEYAVRGPIMARAAEIEKELKEGVKKPFEKVIRANLGDSQAMGQKPITFIRQVLLLAAFPELLDDPRFPEDVKDRVKLMLSGCRGGSVGAYTNSPGIDIIREHVAQFIEKRDGIPAHLKNILIFDGATNAIKSVIKILNENIDGKKAGMMIPIPQYPLYSATLAEFKMEPLGYYLDEDDGWSLHIDELERAHEEAKKVCVPRAICVINPGNPTGQVLSNENIVKIIEFARKHNLFIFADEVYQENLYDENCKFHSFKKVMTNMGAPYNEVEIASFISASKSYTGECGLRGGCVEIINMDPQVMSMLIKCVSAMLCPNVLGQITLDCLVKPPQQGEPSYEKYISEKNGTLKSLALRAKMVTETFNSVPNMSSNEVKGAMYAFPRIQIPEKAIAKAKSQGQCPSAMYCFQLLEETGVCVVPGAGFGQKSGTYHFRTTILPQPSDLKVMLEVFKNFHLKFIEKYS